MAVVAALAAVPSDTRSIVADRVTTLTRASSWTLVASVPIAFRTFHPQGMVKIGETLFVSSVEVIDRDAGKGVGHLFKIDMTGRLCSPICGSGRERSITRAASTTTARTSGCRSPSTVRTAGRSCIASIPRR